MNTKNCLFLTVALALAFVGVESAREIQKAVDKCAVENGLKADQYEGFVASQLDMQLNDCVTGCAMKKLGTMSEDGVYTGENFLETMKSVNYPQDIIEKMTQILTKCITSPAKGENTCDSVKNWRTCLSAEGPKSSPEYWPANLHNQILLYTPKNWMEATKVE